MAIAGKRLALSAAGPGAEQDDDGVVQRTGGAGGRTGDLNLDNVLKLIPGEVIAFFMTGVGLNVPLVPSLPWLWPLIVFLVCLLACAFLRATATKLEGAGWRDGVNWRLVVVSLIAFFIWAHAVSGALPLTAYLPSPAWGFFAILWGGVAPKLVPAG